MKYIMLPIHPNWVCSIMNGIKKIEIRSGTRLYNAINRLIKEQGKAPCLIYCTTGKPYLYQGKWFGSCFAENDKKAYGSDYLNGKVVAMFEASAEEIIFGRTFFDDLGYFTGTLHDFELLKKSCLTKDDLHKYLKVESNGVSGTAIHIHNLKIFDKPKELEEFKKVASKKTYTDLPWLEPSQKAVFKSLSPLTRAPQSYCFCEVDE